MPAYLTHRVAGERVLSKRKELCPAHEAAFFLGCQGPDIMFFHNYQPWRPSKAGMRLGIAMHSLRVRDLMRHALDFTAAYAGPDRDELISYIAGFVTHYAIDKNAHPFVYAKAGDDGEMHHRIEYMWDSYSAKEQWDIEPERFDIYKDIMYGRLGDGICEWYRAAAKDLYGIAIKKDMPRQAQRHFAQAKRGLVHIGLPGKCLIWIIRTVSGFDVRALMYPGQRDQSVFSKEEYADMQRMIVKGVDEAADMIGFACRYIGGDKQPLPAWFGDTDFSGQPQDGNDAGR